MKKKTIITAGILIVLICLAVLGYNALSGSFSPEVHENTSNNTTKAPDFQVFTSEGESVTLSGFEGRPVVVNFWATWCPPCKEELPDFNSAFKEYGDRVEFMMINLTDENEETIDKVQKFVAEEGYEFPVYYDTLYSATATYGVRSIPMTVFVDKQGRISRGFMGMISEEVLVKNIQTLIQ